MFSSFPSLPNLCAVPRFLRTPSKTGGTLTLPPITPHEIETNPDKRARTLKHLLKLNHAQHSVIYHQLRYHNHLPHILGSAYILNSSPDHLNKIYESDSKSLEPWQPSPNEITEDDWLEYLGDRTYQRAYLDFFEDRLVEGGYDWKAVVWKYLFEKDNGLGNNLVAGLGHCIIHLGYAFELQSRELAMETLTLTSCFHDSHGKYLADPAYTFPIASDPSSPAKRSSSTLSVLKNIRHDPRLKSIPRHIGAIGMGDLFKDYETVVLEHWNSWSFDKPGDKNLDVVFEEAQRTPIALLVGSQYGKGKERDYDFFFVHLLTTSHALRILLPVVAELVKEKGGGGRAKRGARDWQVVLLRQWWLFFIAVYIMQGRPDVDEGRFTAVPEQEEGENGKDRKHSGEWSEHEEAAEKEGWDWIVKEAVEGRWSLDAHFVKAVRAIQVAGETWAKDGDGEKWYLDAATTLVREFDGWGGFGSRTEEEAEHLGGHD